MNKINRNLCAIALLVTLTGSLAYAASSDVVLNDPTKPILVTKTNPIFTIKLQATTPGSVWLLKEIDSNFIIPLHRTVHQEETKNKTIIPSYEEWLFEAKPNALKVPYKTTITLIYTQPATMQSIQGNTFTVITLP